MTKRDPVQIGIAVVESDGWYLIGTRRTGQALAGLAEFPGGKCEAGESPVDCAVRECREETGISVVAVRLLERKCHEYAHANVDLHFWLCRVAGPPDELTDTKQKPANGFLWKSVDELRQLSFPDANTSVVEMLISMSESRRDS